MNRPLPLSFAVALALGSSAAQALGLGGINVKSELNQPLRAEIPVYVSSPAEAESLRVDLAAASEFARVGLDIGDLGTPIQFDVGKNARGEPVILVSSNQAIREPTLTFLVEVNWSNGRFLREYSVLLEPPVTVPISAPSAAPITSVPEASVQPIAEAEPMAPEPISEPEAVEIVEESTSTTVETPSASTEPMPAEPTPVEPEPEPLASEATESEPTETAEATPEPTPEPIEPEPTPSESVASAPSAPSASEYGPIASGETLWEISNTTRPSHITPSQMMIALLRANPDAFFRDNVNALKRGAILRIPGESDLQALAAAQAAAEIVSQNQSWIEATRPTTVADASVASTSTAPSTTTSSSTRPGSRLELVPPATGTSASDRPGAPGGTGDNAAVRAELARTKESLTSAQQDAAELRARVKDLEAINTNDQRLLTLKDNELKNLQTRLAAAERAVTAAQADANKSAAAAAAARKAAADTAAATKPAPVETTTPVEAADTAPVTDPLATPADTTTAADATSADPLASADPTDSSTATDPSTTDVTPADATAATDATPTDTTTAEVTPIAEPEPIAVGEPVAPSEPWYAPLMNNYVLGGLGALVLAAIAFFALRRRKTEEPSVVPGSISGQFGSTVGGASEESSMLAALASDPTDLNAHLNVLEFYYMRRNAEKFEAAAEAMYAQLPDPNAPEWQGALLMGRDLCPTHPMFADESDAPARSSSAFADPFAAMPTFEGHAPKAQPAAPPPHDDFDFDLGVAPPAATAPTTKVAASAAESFDFNLIDNTSKRPAAASTPPPAKEEISFDFDLDRLDTGSTQKAEDISFELPSLDFDSAGKTPAAEPTTQQMDAVKDDFLSDDAVATKIDLARAYLDMGDADGARSMLEEVLSEGSDSQKSEAKKLLSEIR